MRLKLFLGLFCATLSSNVAFALQNQSWVSQTGSGTACTITAPCSKFQEAVDVTSPGGVVSVLSSGDDFQSSQFTINKSITVRAVGVDAGGTGTAYNASFLTVNLSESDVVVLDGIRFVGPGLRIQGGGKVFIRNCAFSFNNLAGNAPSPDNNIGVFIRPTSAVRVVISDTVVEYNGISAGGGGFIIKPQGAGSAQVALQRVTAQGNTFGIAVDGSQSTAGINLTVADSLLSSNVNDGLVATSSSGGAPIGVILSNVRSINNGFGIRSIGSNVTVRVEGSKIIGNGTGLSGGGALLTGGGNTVQANGSNGSFTASYSQQ